MSKFDTMMAAAETKIADLYGVEVTYTPLGGDPVTVTATKPPERAEVKDGEFRRNTEIQCEFTIYADIARPSRGDTVETAGGEIWTVTKDGVLEYVPGRLARILCEQEFQTRTGGDRFRSGLESD